MAKRDITTIIQSFFQSYGYSFDEKNRKKQKIKALLLIIDILYVIVLSCVPLENAQLLLLLGDYGFYLTGYSTRNVANEIPISYRGILVLLQLLYIFDDFQWLAKANSYFKQIGSIQVAENIEVIMKRSRTVVKFIAASFFSLVPLIYYINPIIRQEIYLENIPKIFLGYMSQPLMLGIHTYYSGMFAVELYLLLSMNSDFCVQFRSYFESQLQQNPSKKTLTDLIKQFNELYIMLYFINTHLKNTYLILVTCIFCSSLGFYYISLNSPIHIAIRSELFLVCVTIWIVILYISAISGNVDIQNRKLSEFVYKKVVIEQRILLPSLKCEVCL